MMVNKKISERLLFIPIMEEAIKELSVVPILKDRLYKVEEVKTTRQINFLVAKLLPGEIDQLEKYFHSPSDAMIKQIRIPNDLNYPSLLKFIKHFAQRYSVSTVNYKQTDQVGAQISDIDATIFDFRPGSKSVDFAFSERMDEGANVYGTYRKYSEYSRVMCDIVNGYKGTERVPPFDIPFIGLVRRMELYNELVREAVWHEIQIYN